MSLHPYKKRPPCVQTNFNFSTKSSCFTINLLNIWSSIQVTIPTCLSLRSCSHFWHHMNHNKKDSKMSQGVDNVMMQGLPPSHSTSFSFVKVSLWRRWSFLSKLSSHELCPIENAILTQNSLTLFHALCIMYNWTPHESMF